MIVAPGDIALGRPSTTLRSGGWWHSRFPVYWEGDVPFGGLTEE
jgi:hypothetical protein